MFILVFIPCLVSAQETINFEDLPYDHDDNLGKQITVDGFSFAINSPAAEDHITYQTPGADSTPDNNKTASLFENNNNLQQLTKWTIKKVDNADNFKLVSIYLQNRFGSGDGTITAYRDNVQIGAPVTVIFNGVITLSEADFQNIDEIQIDAVDANFYVDDLKYVIDNTWTGSLNNDWNAVANWSTGTIPVTSTNVTIPSGLTNYPYANNISVDSKSITMASGASMRANLSTFSGVFTYNLSIPDTKWHLTSSPAFGEGYDAAWITDNSITTSGPNVGISTYSNEQPDPNTQHWRYAQDGDTGNFNQAEGYALLRESAGDYSFIGTFPTGTITKGITQDWNNWNLIGNPYPSYLDVGLFLSDEAANISITYQALYIWNAATDSYSGRTSGTIHPGQGFFIHARNIGAQMNFKESHQTNLTNTGTFYKEDAATITLKLSDETNSRETLINYIDGKTKGLDPGFDVGMFDGASSNLSLYTRLVEDYEETAFERQALPNSDFETMIIPIGLNATANKEITFSAEALNLPAGLKVFLEDRETNTFARLDETNGVYSVTLSEALNGPGRFYLHTSESALSTSNISLENVSIYKLDNATLRINGVQNSKTNVTLFTVLGKQVLNTAFQSNGVSDISLPKLAAGVYIVQLKNDNGTFQKKIILE